MIRFPLRRAYLPLLLGVLALLLLLQFGSRPNPAKPAPLAASPTAERQPASADRSPLAEFEAWSLRYQGATEARRDSLLSDGRALAAARRDAFLALMRSDPAAALEQALSLEEVARLPAELAPYFERPISGIGSLDLVWRTNLNEDGSLRCRHEHLLHFGPQRWEAVGPALDYPAPPRKDVPVNGIALGKLAVLAPSAVRVLAPREVAAATKLFPTGNPDGIDPVTRGVATAENSALIGGKVYQFESPAGAQHVAGALFAAEEKAREENRYAIEHGFEWLAASGGEGDSGEPPVAETPFMDDTLDVLFIRIDFPDLQGDPVSQVNLETTLNAVKGNVEQFSYNVATIVPTVTPTVCRMPNNAAYYAIPGDNNGIHADASTLASAHFTLSNYDVVAVFFADLSGIPESQIDYAGLASIGGNKHWINGANSTNVILHEFGHNYGLYHSNYWDPSQSLPGQYDVPSSLEYGDIFDVMGGGLAPEGHFNHFAKNRLQWMPDSKVAEPTTDTTVRIYRFDHANALASPTLAAKVPVGGAVYYWVGYRQLYTSPTYNLSTGAYIVAEGRSQGAETNLIDATPGSQPLESQDRNDCGLVIGTPFVDSGVTFTALARDPGTPSEWIDVSISFAARIGLVATNVEVDEQAGLAWLTLQRQFSTTGVATVDYATSNDSATEPADYYATAGTVRWADGDGADKTIAIPIRPDALAEGTERFNVTLSNPTGAALDTFASAAAVSILDPGERYETFSPGFFNLSVEAVVPLSNGQILIGGTISASSGEFANIHNLARLDPDGSVDTTLVTGSGFDAPVNALAVQADGKFLVGGDFTTYNGAACDGLIRLNPDGSIDTNIGGVDNGTVRAIAIESDGKILVGGSFNSFDSTPVEGMVRLTAAGARDTVYALNLPFVTSLASSVEAITVQSDGKIMAAGLFYISAGGEAKSGVARLHTDGTRDTSFDPGEGARFGSFLTSVEALASLPDGMYVIGGSFTSYDGNAVPYMARIDNDGSFDAAFTPPTFDARVQALAPQPAGPIMVGGSFTSVGPQLIRLTSTGAVDSSFNMGTGLSGGTGVRSFAQTDGGPLFVGGNFFGYNGSSTSPILKLAGGTRPYDFWAVANFSTAQLAGGDADPGANPDGDDFNNAAERALGTDPNLWNPDPVFAAGGTGTISLHESGGQRYLEVSVAKSAFSSGAWFVARFTSDLLPGRRCPPSPAPTPSTTYWKTVPPCSGCATRPRSDQIIASSKSA